MTHRLTVLFLVFLLQACENRTEVSAAGVASVSEAPAVLAVEDLSARLGIAADAIKVVSERNVTWPDGSLGCPKEGMMYTQALVEGTQVVLNANGRRYTYHSGNERPPFLCENPQKPSA